MEKIKLLLYCTKSKPLLYKGITAYTRSVKYVLDKEQYLFGKIENLNGKIVAECDFEVEEITPYQYQVNYYEGQTGYKTKTLDFEELLKRSCLTFEKLDKYLYCDIGYAIHIKNLNIFEKPRELNEFYSIHNVNDSIDKAPQNMCKVFELFNDGTTEEYILISIRPEWLVKILNKEKTIEIRKKVLKEML